MATTAGSLALVGAKPPKDAFVVERLRKAGRRHPRQDEPQRVGQHPLQLTPPAAGAAAAARRTTPTPWIATPPARAPARPPPSPPTSAPPPSAPRPTARSSARRSINGIVGLKPTVGLVSRVGDHPHLPHPGHRRADGPHGPRRGDPARRAGRRRPGRPGDARTAEGKAVADYTQVPRRRRPEGGADRRRARNLFGFNDAVDAVMDEALAGAEAAGRDARRSGRRSRRSASSAASEMIVFLYELKADLNAYLERLGPGAPVHSLKEIIAFNEQEQARRRCRISARSCSCRPRTKGPLTDDGVPGGAGDESPAVARRRASTP